MSHISKNENHKQSGEVKSIRLILEVVQEEDDTLIVKHWDLSSVHIDHTCDYDMDGKPTHSGISIDGDIELEEKGKEKNESRDD